MVILLDLILFGTQKWYVGLRFLYMIISDYFLLLMLHFLLLLNFKFFFKSCNIIDFDHQKLMVFIDLAFLIQVESIVIVCRASKASKTLDENGI